MAHFTRTRTVWAANSDLYASEMDSIDGKLFRSINGDDGGVWAPSNQIVIGGAGINVTSNAAIANASIASLVVTGNTTIGDNVADTAVIIATSTFANPASFASTLTTYGTATFNGAASFASSVSVTGALSVGGLATLSGNVSVGGNISAAFSTLSIGNTTIGGTLLTTGNATFNGNTTIGDGSGDALTVNATSAFQAAASFNAGVTFASTSTFNGATTHNATVTLTAPLVFSGDGRATERVTAGGDSGTSGSPTLYSPKTSRVVRFTSLTDNRYAQIDDTGCVNGDVITFLLTAAAGSTYNVYAQTPSAGLTQALKYSSGLIYSVTYRRVGGSWVDCETSIRP